MLNFQSLGILFLPASIQTNTILFPTMFHDHIICTFRVIDTSQLGWRKVTQNVSLRYTVALDVEVRSHN